MSKKFNFTGEEKTQIEEAVKQAEKNTSGEIVPFIVNKSAHYGDTAVYAALSAAIFMVIMLNVLAQLWLLPFKFDTLIFSVIVVGFMALVYLPVAFINPLKRFMINPKRMDNAVNRRALQAFVEEEVFNTRDRSGILIFVSQFEHRVELLADKGINEKVKPEEWESVVSNLIQGIKKKQTANALAEAVTACGNILQKAGMEIKSDDTNELSDGLRMDELKKEDSAE